MNVELLRRVQESIKSNAHAFDMQLWFESHGYKYGNPLTQPECGTTACIAGFVCLLEGWVPDSYHGVRKGSYFDEAELVAAKLLQLNSEDKDALFQIEEWPEDLQIAYREAEDDLDHSGMASAACEVIDRLIAA